MFKELDKWKNKLDTVKLCENYEFKGFSPLVKSECKILVLQKNDTEVVICSQLENYYGTSITNAVERIWQSLVDKRTISTSAIWYEHYPIGEGLIPDMYSIVRVKFDENGSPTWGAQIHWEELSKRYDIPVEALAYGYDNELLERQ